MKHLQKSCILSIILIGLVTFSCQDNIDLTETIETTKVDKSKLIDFKGLPVNHRFSTPIKELEIEHTKNNLKKIYNKERFSNAKKKGIAFKVEVELPSEEIIIEGTNNVIDQFPYKDIFEEKELERTPISFFKDSLTVEEYQEILVKIKQDSVALVTYEKEYQIKQEAQAEANWRMIKNDFPTLSETQIEENIDLIDDYYSQNLDYVVLEEIAKNEDELANKVATKQNKISKNNNRQANKVTGGKEECVAKKIISLKWGFARATYAMALASTRASTSAGNYYPDSYGDYYGYVGGGGSNTRGDAYRHILWNALLADYYYTVSEKVKRVAFAKAVADANEECNEDNIADGEAMDYHNNIIGRKIWYDNTSYRKTWFGWIYGLNTPSTSTIKDLVRKAVDEKSCFIKKTIFDGANKDYSAEEIKVKIENTDSNTPVYFAGTIAPGKLNYVYGSDYSNCYYIEWMMEYDGLTKAEAEEAWGGTCPTYGYTWKKTPPCYEL